MMHGTSWSVSRSVMVGLASLIAAAAFGAADGVSPGEVDQLVDVESRCPTFSWRALGAARGYELVAYEIRDDQEIANLDGQSLTADPIALYQRLPAGVTSWTPSLDRCLRRGGRYVWFVRARGAGDNGPETGSDWSRGRFFRVSATPSRTEIEAVLEFLRGNAGSEAPGSPGRAKAGPRNARSKAETSVAGRPSLRAKKSPASGDGTFYVQGDGTVFGNAFLYNCAAPTTYYPDLDGDTFGDESKPTKACTALSGFITTGGDCDDAQATINPSATEVCDGIDNDCNGSVDDGDPGGGGSCDTGQLGVCGPGTEHCQGGALTCVADQSPSAEVCDGLDNDCNGAIDDGSASGGQCGTSDVGACRYGSYQCTDGAMTCVGNVDPTPETCNNIDDNCDGTTDEGDPGGGAACDTGLLGVCEAGTTHCEGGTLTCVQDTSPSPENCSDGVDNDCDGLVDGADPDCA